METPRDTAAATAELSVQRAGELQADGRYEDALATLEAVIARFGAQTGPPAADSRGTPADASPAQLELARVIAFARLSRIQLLLAGERTEEAAAAAGGLLAMVEGLPEGAPRSGFGTMGLDVAFWMLAAGRDRDALRIAQALVQLLGDGDDGERAVAAGARFIAARAAARLGHADDARFEITALCAMGEPALAALDRIASRFGGAETDPGWHAQVAAATVTVLWRLGRAAEARTLAGHAADHFAAVGLGQLEVMLRDLAHEIAVDG